MRTRRSQAAANSASDISQAAANSASDIPPSAVGSPATGVAAAATPTHEYEFCGPYLGPLGIVIGLPALVWSTATLCTRSNGWPPADAAGLQSWLRVPVVAPTWATLSETLSAEAFFVYCAWFALQVLLHLIVPGSVVRGAVLADGYTLPYKINGWRCFIATHVVIAALHISGLFPLTWIVDHFPQLATSATIFASALSVVLYAASFAPGRGLAPGGNTGVHIYDFFIGRELNPRITSIGSFRLPAGTLDLKYFCELRPGLFLWHFINVAMALRQYEQTGSVDVTMAIVVALQALYVADSVVAEESILTTMDIIMDGFGFMLAFGDLAWVPFMYTLQTRFLADFPQRASPGYSAACCVVAIGGYWIFRSANAQKDRFKKEPSHPSVKDLAAIVTPTGSRLLADGWWAVSRHVNYLGDWLLAVGMSLPTGFVTPLTYFYPAYFAVLLVHRERRDEHKCAAKYGAAWTQYKDRVPYRIVPFLY